MAPREANIGLVTRLAVIGDAHGAWSEDDVIYFNRAGYDLLLFVGDLGSGSRQDGLVVIRSLGALRTPGLLLPGNNDAPHLGALQAELAHQSGRASLERVLGEEAPRGVRPVGYSVHEIETLRGPISIIACRPCSMGGPNLSFPEVLGQDYGVQSLEESAERICALVDRAASREVLFFAHNGPTGLGEQTFSPFGRDFSVPEPDAPLDWGDPDLARAVDYAVARGKVPLAVVAGHMHRRSRRRGQGEARPFRSELGGVPVYNVAEVPRIVSDEDGTRHHHIEVRFSPERVEFSERWERLG